jgi:hypothetical protein
MCIKCLNTRTKSVKVTYTRETNTNCFLFTYSRIYVTLCSVYLRKLHCLSWMLSIYKIVFCMIYFFWDPISRFNPATFLFFCQELNVQLPLSVYVQWLLLLLFLHKIRCIQVLLLSPYHHYLELHTTGTTCGLHHRPVPYRVNVFWATCWSEM